MIEIILEHWDEVFMIITGLLSIGWGIAKMTPNKNDDEIIGKIQAFFDVWNGKKL